MHDILPQAVLCSIWGFVKHCKTPLSNVLSLCSRTPPYVVPILTTSFHFHQSFQSLIRSGNGQVVPLLRFPRLGISCLPIAHDGILVLVIITADRFMVDMGFC